MKTDKEEKNIANFLFALGQVMRSAREYTGIDYIKVADVTEVCVADLVLMECGTFEGQVIDLYKVGRFYIDYMSVKLMCPGEDITPKKMTLEFGIKRPSWWRGIFKRAKKIDNTTDY